MVSGWSNNTKYYSESCINNNLYCHIYFKWMLEYSNCNCYRKCSSISECKFISNLCGTKCNTHCDSITAGRNLFMVTWWSNNTKHYSESCINNNLYGYIFFIGL